MSDEEIVQGMEQLEIAYHGVASIIGDLIGLYGSKGEAVNREKAVEELEKVEQQNSEASERLLYGLQSMQSASQRKRVTYGLGMAYSGDPVSDDEERAPRHESESLHVLSAPVTHDSPEVTQAVSPRHSPAGTRRLMAREVSNSTSESGAVAASSVRLFSAGARGSDSLARAQDGTSELTMINHVAASPDSPVTTIESNFVHSRAATMTIDKASNAGSASASSRSNLVVASGTSSSASFYRPASRALPTQSTQVLSATWTRPVASTVFAPRQQSVPLAAPVTAYLPQSTLSANAPQFTPWALQSSPQPGAHTLTSGIIPPATGTDSTGALHHDQPTGPWSQLRKIGIPVFSGEKRKYEAWKAAFMACVDSAPATPEYKLLQLKEYLRGEPFDAIDSLGYSATGYEAAKQLLDRKYGGVRRRVVLQLEELDRMVSVGYGKARELERFTELLTIAVVNLKDAGRAAELEAGTFYTRLLQKFDERSLAQYHRWRHEKGKMESVEVLLEWTALETEFLVMSAETVHGMSQHTGSRDRQSTAARGPGARPQPRHAAARTHFTESTVSVVKTTLCAACSEQHPTWKCMAFRVMEPSKRWGIAKRADLCYRCLGRGHAGKDCNRDRECGIDGCKQHHHHLLHDEQKIRMTNRQKASKGDAPNSQGAATGTGKTDTSPRDSSHVTQVLSHATEGEQVMTSQEQAAQRVVALRTVPVVLQHGDKKVTVNALLDDASTRSYISTNVAGALGLNGDPLTLTVGKLNGQTGGHQHTSSNKPTAER